MDQLTARDIDRFMSKVQIDPETGHWLWTGALNDRGYGVFRLGSKTVKAHRLSWWIHKGECLTDPAVELDHVCRLRSCVCPHGHLEKVSHQENNARRDVAQGWRTKRALKELDELYAMSVHAG